MNLLQLPCCNNLTSDNINATTCIGLCCANPSPLSRLLPPRAHTHLYTCVSVCIVCLSLSARWQAEKQKNKQTVKSKQTRLSSCRRHRPVTKVSSLLFYGIINPFSQFFTYSVFCSYCSFQFHFQFESQFLSAPLADCQSNIILQLPDEEVLFRALSYQICIVILSRGAHKIIVHGCVHIDLGNLFKVGQLIKYT